MQRVYTSVKRIEEVVDALLPPRMNKFIGCFKLEFLLSTLEWEKELPKFINDDYVVIVGARNITYTITKASVEEEIQFLKEYLDETYEYSDDHNVWKNNFAIKERINKLNKYVLPLS